MYLLLQNNENKVSHSILLCGYMCGTAGDINWKMKNAKKTTLSMES